MKKSIKLISAIIIAVAFVTIMVGIIDMNTYKEEEPRVAIPLPQSNNMSNMNITETSTLPLSISLSQISNSSESLNSANITKGGTLTINVDLLLGTTHTELNIPLYLSVSAFNNERSAKVIACPPSPYPSLPWPDHDDSPNMTKPFEASFNSNPINLKPSQKTSVTLTITALDDVQLGTYTLMVELGESKKTGVGGALFYLTVLPE